MTGSPVWAMFAFKDGDDDGADDERRRVVEWRVEDAFRWARYRGYDTIMFTREKDDTAEYRQPVRVKGVRHSG